jgi:hypothetical protein
MARFQIQVVAIKPGFYGDREHFPSKEDDLRGAMLCPSRAGQQFTMLADALRYDEDGKMEVEQKGGKLYPVLPTWVRVIGECPAIDPKTPHIVKPRTKKVHPSERVIPEEVLAAAPEAYPKNVKKRAGMDPDRVVKIAKRSSGFSTGASSGEDED